MSFDCVCVCVVGRGVEAVIMGVLLQREHLFNLRMRMCVQGESVCLV